MGTEPTVGGKRFLLGEYGARDESVAAQTPGNRWCADAEHN